MDANSEPSSQEALARPDKTETRSRKALLWIALALIAIVVHLPGISGESLPDDDRYISDNHLLTSWSGLKSIWLDPSALDQYYPLTFTSFWLEQKLWGTNLAGYHVVNILLHAAGTLLLYALLGRLAIPGAWLAACLFAVHPVNVASVGWVAERKNVLSGALMFASLLCWVRLFMEDRTHPAWRRWGCYAPALGLFCLALLSKTATCTLPVVVLILIWWRTGRAAVRELLALIPAFIAAAAMGVVTIWAEATSSGAADAAFDFTVSERVLIAGRALWFYLGLMVWPFKAVMVHPRWQIDAGAWQQWLYPATFVAVILVAWLARRRTGRSPLAAILLFAVVLSPTLGLASFSYMQHSFVADHFVYLAGVIPIVVCASALAFGASRLSGKRGLASWVAAGVVVAALAGMTWKRSKVFADPRRLWDDTIARNPNSAMAYNCRGVVHNDEGNLDQALSDYSKATALDPEDPLPYHNRANILVKMDNYAAAIAEYTKAVGILTGADDLWESKVRRARAIAYTKAGDLQGAIGDYSRLTELDPDSADVYVDRAAAFGRLGRYKLAIADCDRAIELSPENYRAFWVRAGAYQGKGNLDRCLADFDRVVTLGGATAIIYNNRATILMSMGRYEEAVSDFRKAMELAGEYRTACLAMGMALLESGDVAEAIDYWRSAASRHGDWPDLLNALAWILATHGEASVRNGAEAVELAEKACKLTGYRSPAMLDTLAAAHAEAGQFDQAVSTIRKAIELATQAGQDAAADEMSVRQKLYQAGKAFRQ